jgi:hypothetical protein
LASSRAKSNFNSNLLQEEARLVHKEEQRKKKERKKLENKKKGKKKR